jgi:beta-galactosidase
MKSFPHQKSNKNLLLKSFHLLIYMLLFSRVYSAQDSRICLAGDWQVKLDTKNEILSGAGPFRTEGMIALPGSLAENGYGIQTVGSDFGILTPEYKFIGKAWYSRQIHIPASWKNKEIELFLERVLWESTVLVDGMEISRQDALGTPHIHRLGKIVPGEHTLTVLVDNEMIHNIGDKGHAYSDYTQSIWNGIVGRMEMRAYDPVRIETVRTFPDLANDILRVEINLNSPPVRKTTLEYTVRLVKTGEIAISGKVGKLSMLRTVNKSCWIFR